MMLGSYIIIALTQPRDFIGCFKSKDTRNTGCGYLNESNE